MGTFKVPKIILDVAKAMDTPQMRELYRSQKKLDPSLDHDCEELTEEIQEILDHLENSFGKQK